MSRLVDWIIDLPAKIGWDLVPAKAGMEFRNG
jgi:hypothetical protein